MTKVRYYYKVYIGKSDFKITKTCRYYEGTRLVYKVSEKVKTNDTKLNLEAILMVGRVAQSTCQISKVARSV